MAFATQIEERYEQMRHVARDLVYGRTVLPGCDVQEVALTFDDGPNDPYTLQLLELLARYQVRATFFLVGNFVRRRPDIARAIHQAGHLLGNHTMTHPSLLWERPSRVREELANCSAAIEDATGEAVEWFRPPFGARRRDVHRIAAELGMASVMWNVTAYDWDPTEPDAVVARVQSGIHQNQRRHRGSNILMHDGGHQQMGADRLATLVATGSLLEAWAGSALQVVTVDVWR